MSQYAEEVTRVQELVYEIRVGQVMTTEITTISPDSLMRDLRGLMREKRISGLPVVEKDTLVGLVSIEDFITCLADGDIDQPVGERMTRDVVTLSDNDHLTRALEKFEHYDFGRFPVLHHKTGNLVGIITKGDILRGLLSKLEIDYHEKEARLSRVNHRFEDITGNHSVFTFQYNLIGQDIERAGESSSKLKKTLRRLGIRPDILRRVAIATYEAEMNTVLYAKGGQLTVRVTPESIAVEVDDSGPGIEDIDKAMEPGYSTATDWIRELGFGAGMGLPNIKKSADEMHLDSTLGKGTQVRFTVQIN